jgi:TRAP-type mannitol/chloroaromatic compound transport system permease small subunit
MFAAASTASILTCCGKQKVVVRELGFTDYIRMAYGAGELSLPSALFPAYAACCIIEASIGLLIARGTNHAIKVSIFQPIETVDCMVGC